MINKALLIGNSDGIGLATTRALLEQGWRVDGISRSRSAIERQQYMHFVISVQDEEYISKLDSLLENDGPPDLCIYFARVGELLNLQDMSYDVEAIEVNLLGMVKTVSRVIPAMVKRGSGHFIGLSSVADELLSAEAPGYHASKAGFSNYLEGLALALRGTGVSVTNVRFGFVDTKMAKGDVRPLMMSVDRAVDHVLTCMRNKPVRYTAPRIAIPLVGLRKWMLKLGLAS